jgi:hypothetical protein
VSAVEDDYPFHSVSHALSCAYLAESRDLYQRDSTFSQLRGGGVRLKASPYWEGATAHDRAAEAGKVVGLVRRTLKGPVLLAVEAYYLPNDKAEPSVVFLKQYSCASLIPYVRDELPKNASGEFLAAVIAGWSKLVPLDHEEWAERLGVTERTLRMWRNGRRGGSRGIEGALNDYLDEARVRLGNPMRDYGLIP